MILKIVGITLSLLTTTDFIESKIHNSDNKIMKPVDKVSIIIPSLNEELFIEQCLKSLRNQSIVKQYPEYFEYIFVDNNSTDNTIKFATPYVDKIIINKNGGKLTSRNIGTLNSKGNIIVSVDADMTFSYHWLNTILKPFNDYNVAGVSGSIVDIYNNPFLLKPIQILVNAIHRNLVHPTQMYGGNSAYWKHLFYMNNQFNININQKNVKEVVKEEEIDFGHKLFKFGKVIYKSNALGIHLGGEKVMCRHKLKSSESCRKYEIGIKRFG